VIWTHPAPDGVTLEVSVSLKPLKGYREEHEFMVRRVRPDGVRHAVCKVGEDGVPKAWFVSGGDKAAMEAAMTDLPNAILVELVSRS
jgi:hypothetical protein